MAELKAAKLNALTSLRFVAAAMIVLYHSDPTFGKYDPFKNLAKDQAVSFFFVLSGFILSYVYPKLDSFGEVRRFIAARFARIWPAHMFAFLLVLVLIPSQRWLSSTGSTTHAMRKVIASICLVQAWIPKRGYFFAFNAPSWSISTEFFFYLCFHLLIYRWKYLWKIKLAAVFVLTVLTIVFTQAMHLPSNDISKPGVSTEGLVYISPLARLLEFTFGMTVYLAWEKLRSFPINRLWGTVLELLSIGVVVLASIFVPHRAAMIGNIEWLGHAGVSWFVQSGNLVFFALLILVMGLERGFVSQILSVPFAVTLGEISFSVYLLHGILLWFYYLHIASFSRLPDWLVYAAYWLLLLLLAHLVWQLVERPARKRLAELFAPTDTVANRTTVSREQSVSRLLHLGQFLYPARWLIAELLLLGGLLLVIAVHI
jgi:peptidoglycan/LPS O-acetylase OafA/YrhL